MGCVPPRANNKKPEPKIVSKEKAPMDLSSHLEEVSASLLFRKKYRMSFQTINSCKIAKAVDWHYFNPAVVANVLSTDVPLYTQDRIMELVTWIIKYESRRFKTEWESGNTTEGLMLADALNDVLEALGK